MDLRVQQGRLVVSGVIAVCLVISLSTILLTNMLTASSLSPQQAIRFVLTMCICLALYYGRNWARWVLGILLAIAGLGALGAGVMLLSRTPFALLLVLMGMLYLCCVAALVFPPSVKAFFAAAR